MDILNLKDKKRDILNFQSLYLNRMNKISLSFWILDLLKLRYLVLQIRDILSLKENQDEGFKKYLNAISFINELSKLFKLEKKRKKEELINKIKFKLPYWKPLKGKTVVE